MGLYKLLILCFTISIGITFASVISNIYSIQSQNTNFATFQQQTCHNGSCTVTNCSNGDPCKTSNISSNRSSSSSLLPFSNGGFPTLTDLFP